MALLARIHTSQIGAGGRRSVAADQQLRHRARRAQPQGRYRGLLRGNGWIEAFVDPKPFAREAAAAEHFARTHTLRVQALTGDELGSAVRGVQGGFAGALRWPDVYSTVDPWALVSGYAQLFVAGGGQLMTGDARSLQQDAAGWRVSTAQGAVDARDAVIALGPWSAEFMRRLGYRWPLGIKRGYHMHYAPVAGQELARPALPTPGSLPWRI